MFHITKCRKLCFLPCQTRTYNLACHLNPLNRKTLILEIPIKSWYVWNINNFKYPKKTSTTTHHDISTIKSLVYAKVINVKRGGCCGCVVYGCSFVRQVWEEIRTKNETPKFVILSYSYKWNIQYINY